jgi:hypothetical protein
MKLVMSRFGYAWLVTILIGVPASGPSIAQGTMISLESKSAYTPWCVRRGALCLSMRGDATRSAGALKCSENSLLGCLGYRSYQRVIRMSVARSERR